MIYVLCICTGVRVIKFDNVLSILLVVLIIIHSMMMIGDNFYD